MLEFNKLNKTFTRGIGKRLFNQIVLKPENNYILGVEVYLNGIANFLKLATKSQNDNFRLD